MWEEAAVLMTLQPIPTLHGPHKWYCDGCHTWSFWTETHMIYGSIKDEDEGNWNQLVVTCSDACRQLTIVAGQAAALETAEPRPT